MAKRRSSRPVAHDEDHPRFIAERWLLSEEARKRLTTPSQRFVAWLVVSHLDWEWSAYPGVARLTRLSKHDESTVRRALRVLTEGDDPIFAKRRRRRRVAALAFVKRGVAPDQERDSRPVKEIKTRHDAHSCGDQDRAWRTPRPGMTPTKTGHDAQRSKEEHTTRNKPQEQTTLRGVRETPDPTVPVITLEPPKPTRQRDGEPEGFARAYSTFPHHPNRRERKKALAVWKREKLEPLTDAVLAWIEAESSTDNWQREQRRYVPAMHRWLKGRDFTETPPVAAQALRDEEVDRWEVAPRLTDAVKLAARERGFFDRGITPRQVAERACTLMGSLDGPFSFDWEPAAEMVDKVLKQIELEATA